MTRAKTTRFAVALLMLLAAGAAWASTFEIQNSDATGYAVFIKCGGISTTAKVGSRSTCVNCGRSGPYPCTVTVTETGSTVTVAGPTRIVIKDGKAGGR